MNSNMNPIPLFRPSCATRIEARWTPGRSWVRPRIHYAIRRTQQFFLRPWDGVVLAWKRWSHAVRSAIQSENERGVPANPDWNKHPERCFNLLTGIYPDAKWNARRLDEEGTLQLDSLPSLEEAGMQMEKR